MKEWSSAIQQLEPVEGVHLKLQKLQPLNPEESLLVIWEICPWLIEGQTQPEGIEREGEGGRPGGGGLFSSFGR